MDTLVDRNFSTTDTHTDDESGRSADKATAAQFVGSIPEAYDRHLGPLLFDFSGADMAERVAKVHPRSGRLLEVACGTGIATEHLWRALGPDVEIVATDLNDSMLDHARENRGTLKGVSFRQADAQSLPFEDGSFDTVVCQFGIMFFPDKAKALAEFERVLRPGGTLVFTVWDSLEKNRVADISQKTIASFFETDPPDFLTVPFGFYEIEPIQTLINGAGLSVRDVQTVSDTIERPQAISIARGFVEGNPGILQIRERGEADPEDIIQEIARAVLEVYGPEPVHIPLQEITFVAEKS